LPQRCRRASRSTSTSSNEELVRTSPQQYSFNRPPRKSVHSQGLQSALVATRGDTPGATSANLFRLYG
jgi:hypothetical protein